MDRPLRIAVFVGSFPVVSETFILRQITGLCDLRHEVDIYADTRGGSLAHPEVQNYRLLERTTFMDMPPEVVPWEMPILPITGRTWIPGETRSRSNLGRAARALPVFLKCLAKHPRLTINVLRPDEYGFQADSLSVLYRLHRLIKKPQGYDVLHAHFGPNGNSFRFARELWKAPLVVSFHGYDFTTVPRKQGAGVYQKLFQTADVITVNSEFSRSRILNLGVPVSKLHKLPVGLNPELFPYRDRILKPGETVRILSIGRLVSIKGHEFAIEAIAKLRQQHPNIHYSIVGEGPQGQSLGQLIKERNLSDHVTLCGALTGPAFKKMIDDAHLFLMPSVSIQGDAEGQGLVMQEAQCAGLPVIATNHGALPEGMLPERSGFLVPERDIQSLCDRLGYLVEHPAIWPTLGRAGREFVAGLYDIRELNLELVALYEQAVMKYNDSKDVKPFQLPPPNCA